MQKTRRLVATALLSFMLLSLLAAIGSEKAYACSCLAPESYAKELEKSTHVFDAVVADSQEGTGGNLDVTLTVQAVWKGELERETHVSTPGSSAACGYYFEVGERYAVFANEHEGRLQVLLCSATTKLSDESPIFEELGEPVELSDQDQSNEPEQTSGEPSAPVSSGAVVQSDKLSPDEIKLNVTTEELEQKMDVHQSRLPILFVIIGALPIVGAIVLLVSRKRRS